MMLTAVYLSLLIAILQVMGKTQIQSPAADYNAGVENTHCRLFHRPRTAEDFPYSVYHTGPYCGHSNDFHHTVSMA